MATSWIKSIFHLWNRKLTTRENFHEGAGENKMYPWKMWKKCAWKHFFVREKIQKKAKKTFNAHFWFSRRKKKNTDRNHA